MTLPTGIPQTVKFTDWLLEGEGQEEGLMSIAFLSYMMKKNSDTACTTT